MDEYLESDIEVMKDECTPHHAHYLKENEADIVCANGHECCTWPIYKDEQTGDEWAGADFMAYSIWNDRRAILWDAVRLIQCKAIIHAAQIRKPQPTDPKRWEVWHYTAEGEPMHKATEGNPYICPDTCKQLVRHKYDEATGKLVEKTYPVSFTQSIV